MKRMRAQWPDRPSRPATDESAFVEMGQQDMASRQSTTFSAKSVAVAVLRNRRGFLAILCLGLALALAYVTLTPVTYIASTQVLLEPLPRKPIAVASDGIADPLDSAQADSRMYMAKSERLLSFVFDTVDWPKLNGATAPKERRGLLAPSTDWIKAFFPAAAENDEVSRTKAFTDFSDKVSVKRLGLSYVIEISFQAHTPQLARFMANAVTAAYLRSLVVSSQIDDELLQRRVVNVKAEEQALLAAIKRGAIPDESFPDANARVISAAILPVAKATPKTALIFILALSVSLGTGILSSIVRAQSDRRIRTPADIIHLLRLKVLASFELIRHRPVREASSGFSQWVALHAARDTQPLLAEITEPTASGRCPVIGFVACHEKAGTSSVTLGITRQVTGLGHYPILVDANGAPGSLSEAVDANEMGLKGALLSGAAAENLHLVAVDNFKFLPYGRKAGEDRPLDMSKLGEVLRHLSMQGPVLVDLPSIENSFDAQVMCRHVDAIVLVVTAGRTTIDQLARALERLPRQKVNGYVLNRAKAGQRNRPDQLGDRRRGGDTDVRCLAKPAAEGAVMAARRAV